MSIDLTDPPPCPDCGAQLSDESGTDEDGPFFRYECLVCCWSWRDNGEDEPLTVATAPWTRALAAELVEARRERDEAHAEADDIRDVLLRQTRRLVSAVGLPDGEVRELGEVVDEAIRLLAAGGGSHE
jgi:hypothetical protein